MPVPCAWLVAFAVATAFPGRAPLRAARAQEVPPTAGEHPVSEATEAARRARLERDRVELQARLGRMQRQPWAGGWLAAVDEALAAHMARVPNTRAREGHDPRWVRTADGYLRQRTLELELTWNRPSPGRVLDYCVDVEAPGHPFATVVDLHRQLAASGIPLLVVPVPTRLNLFPELVLDEDQAAGLDSGFPGHAPGLARFLSLLSEAGVETVDLLPVLASDRFGTDSGREEQVFLKYNMHWTPRGALAAARAVAARIEALGVLPAPGEGEAPESITSHERAPWAPHRERGFPEGTTDQELDFVRVTTPQGDKLEFESKESPLLLLGDSFGNHFSAEHASFELQLQRLLARPLDTVVIRGGGIAQTRKVLSWRTPETGIFSKRVVVWLFSSTALVDDEWQPVDFR